MQAKGDSEADAGLIQLGRALLSAHYQFTTVTPLTHERFLARHQGRWAADARDVFGWNLPFYDHVLPPQWLAWMRDAGVLETIAGGWRSRVRFSRLGPLLLAHGSFPTAERDAVFFGPDTYRFATFLRQHVQHAASAVDIGSGSGAGGLALGRRLQKLVCADLSVQALRMSKINAAINAQNGWGMPSTMQFCESDLYRDLDGQFDLIVANPPYIQDDAGRLYRHGGDRMGTDLSVRIVQEGLERLTPTGQLLLYTGSPVVRGVCIIAQALSEVVANAGGPWDVVCHELDPDVFGEELGRPCYADAERLAVIGVVVRRVGKAAIL